MAARAIKLFLFLGVLAGESKGGESQEQPQKHVQGPSFLASWSELKVLRLNGHLYD